MPSNYPYTAQAYATLVEGGKLIIPTDGTAVQVVVVKSSSLPMRMLSILLYA